MPGLNIETCERCGQIALYVGNVPPGIFGVLRSLPYNLRPEPYADADGPRDRPDQHFHYNIAECNACKLSAYVRVFVEALQLRREWAVGKISGSIGADELEARALELVRLADWLDRAKRYIDWSRVGGLDGVREWAMRERQHAMSQDRRAAGDGQN